MQNLTIGQLAKQSQLSRVTIRYYERCGLLPTAIRSQAGYRQYPQTMVCRLRFIKNAQQVGFTLAEIGELLALQAQSQNVGMPVKEKVQHKIKVLQTKVATLQTMLNTLEHLSTLCDGKMPIQQCPILERLYDEVATR